MNVKFLEYDPSLVIFVIVDKQQFVMMCRCRYVSDKSSHANALARLHVFFIIATRPTAAEEFRIAAILESYIIQNTAVAEIAHFFL